MTENDFNGLFGDDFDEIASALADAEAEEIAQKAAEAPAVKDGLWYSHDEDNADGHAISVYAVNAHGKTFVWVRVDNFVEVSTDAFGKVPAGITGHPIVVSGATGGKLIETPGVALKAPHQDGTGAHIDGQSVRSYVLPRLTRFIAELYGV